jgi:D-arginine dehydrogenase
MTSSFDIIIIGAGMAGASAAAELSRDRRVLVLERESHPGAHATGRSAALYSTIYGNAPVRALTRASRTVLQQGLEGDGDGVLSPRGSLFIATQRQGPRLDAFAALPDVAGQTRRLSAHETLELVPFLRSEVVAGGVLEPGAMDIDVHRLHQAYLRRARQGGAVLRTDASVVALSREDGVWSVKGPGGEDRAPVLINAAGAWADAVAALAGLPPLGLTPLRRTIALVDPPAMDRFETAPHVIDIDEKFYFKPDAGRLLLTPADETPSPPCDAAAEDFAIALAIDRIQAVAHLKVAHIRAKWAGLRTFAPDRTPVVGFDPRAPGFFWLAGQGGYGIQTAPAMARAAAALARGEGLPRDLVAEGVEPGALSPDRFTAQGT